MPPIRLTSLLACGLLLAASFPAMAGPGTGFDVQPWPLGTPFRQAVDSPAPAPVATLAATSTHVVPAAGTPAAGEPAGTHLRRMLADFAVTLRDIRYRRGGRTPSTGFECSGFVSYVFRHTLGKDLPATSASQFHAGTRVDRADLRTGDLVFFRTRGKRVSHVGIYLDHGRFIHSPSAGKTVSIDSLDASYWSRHYAGAKRPDVFG
jgi:cell wall-associated NlpC family hydrolase